MSRKNNDRKDAMVETPLLTPPAADPLELGDNSPVVVAYRVGQLEKAVLAGFKEHNEKLDKLANNFSTKEETQALDKRLTSLENDRKWLVRLILATVLIAVLSLVLGGAHYLNK